MSLKFELVSDYEPKGDQPKAIDQLHKGVLSGKKHQVLLGVTGSGKTFTIAHLISRLNRPTLIIAHNKTLAAQLYGELKQFFPNNAVHYFVSYYDYYQPEAYIPQTDTYIAKDASINEHIDRLRHEATSSLFERRDVVIVSSVSSIYGIGAPEDYYGMHTTIKKGMKIGRARLIDSLKNSHYSRTSAVLKRGTFRIRGDVIDVLPSHEETTAVRVEFFGDFVDAIKQIDPDTGKTIKFLKKTTIFPGTHYVAPEDKIKIAIDNIKKELKERLSYLEANGLFLERDRLEERTNFDIELLETMGFCPGIENYSRHISGRAPGQKPWTIIDYFPDDMLFILDESHQTVPQIRGMYRGDRSRKITLVDNGFRLPSALDNRPLNFEEFEEIITQAIYVSATPGQYELNKSDYSVAEQIIRPTGLAEPETEIRSAQNQVDDLIDQIGDRIEMGDRILVTTLTKSMAEDLTEYLREFNFKVEYIHSEIQTLERIRIIRDLRLGKFDVLVGINLLREGLDIPEVSLVAILDADKEGFLRSETSLIQTFGRCARNIRGKAILYADVITKSMRSAIMETRRRKKLQMRYNKVHNITPMSVKKGISNILSSVYEADYLTVSKDEEYDYEGISPEKISPLIQKLTREMKSAAKKLEFETADERQKQIKKLREIELEYLGNKH